MSIPPLVCSTPPPPDQCEDDKDIEDMVARYDLSQEDEDDSNDYEYSNFSSYDNFNPLSHANNQLDDVLKQQHQLYNVLPPSPSTDTTESNSSKMNVKKTEEELVEDLDLNLDQISINSGKLSQSSQENSDKEMKQVSSELSEKSDDVVNSSETSPISESLHEELSLEDKRSNEDLAVAERDSTKVVQRCGGSGTYDDIPISQSIEDPRIQPYQTTALQNFDDEFDDFQSEITENTINVNSAPVVDSVNPWASAIDHEAESGVFGEFKADFDDFKTFSDDKPLDNKNESPVSHISNHNTGGGDDDDDDFGDFDDFKSSVPNETSVYTEDSTLPQVNVHSLMQSDEYCQLDAEKVINSIFECETTDDETAEFNGKLETSLCETWGHLSDVEIRQPYMVTWNNSVGQKTLLKALCIDSRNILYGPKWSQNVPKFAANLCVAPLQPQKQVSSIESTQSDTQSLGKPNKVIDSWVDPFSSDGKESCITETGPTISTTQAREMDLSIFELPNQSKPEKIFSSTVKVQPLRQISLPDTHIFTPTDSETPRSKTIHYNNSSIMLPQISDTRSREDDYSDFQDFKGSLPDDGNNSEVAVQHENASPSNSSLPFQTSLLQPIRVEPVMPTLNWPDPGEIKETFDDFSDFISNSNMKEETPVKSASSDNDTSQLPVITSLPKVDDLNSIPKDVVSPNCDFDDDFDTFQSATCPIPNDSSAKNDPLVAYVSKSTNERVVQDTTQHTSAINVFQSPVTKNLNIKFPNGTSSMSPSSQSFSFESSSVVVNPPVPNNSSNELRSPQSTQAAAALHSVEVLQPSAAQTQPRGGQILHPLSLEGYSQINWPDPGSIDLQDLSRFNPVETLSSLKSESSCSRTSSPAHAARSKPPDDDWGEFVSSQPPPPPPADTDDDDWTDFVSSPSVQPPNGVKTISLNVHTNLNVQKISSNKKRIGSGSKQLPLDIPALNYVTPKTNNHRAYSDRHFQNL